MFSAMGVPQKTDLRTALSRFQELGALPGKTVAENRRARLVQGTSLGIIILAPPTVYFYHEIGLSALAWFLALMVAVAFGNLFLLRQSGDLLRASHGAMAILFSWLVVENAVVGGIHDPNFAWLNVVPLAAFLLLGVRGALGWLGATLVAAVAFWWLDEVSWTAPYALPLHERGIQALVNRTTALAAFGLLAWSFVHAQRRAETELVREAAYVNLLREAASSAAEADSLGSALKETASRVAREMSWMSALVYEVNSKGEASLVDVAYLDPEREQELRPIAEITAQKPRLLPAHAVKTGRVAVLDVRHDSKGSRGQRARELGIGTAWAVPIFSRGAAVAVLEFTSSDAARYDTRLEAVLGLMGDQLGRVVDRTAANEEEQASRRITAVGTLAAGLAHELNNPLAYARANLAQLSDALENANQSLKKADAEALEDCENLVQETTDGVERAISLVRDMRKLSQLADTDFETVNVRDWVQGAIRFSAPSRPPGIQLHVDVATDLEVRGAPNLLHQVLVNLLENAVQSVGEVGRVSVEAEGVSGGLRLRVEDDGAGIPSEFLDRLFEPFLTTRAEGTGLGLYVAYEVIRRHGGRIQVRSEQGEGAQFEIWLPDAAAVSHAD